MPKVIRMSKSDGFFVDPKSECCKAPVMFYNREIRQYTKVPITFDSLPRDVRFVCFACGKELKRNVKC